MNRRIVYKRGKRLLVLLLAAIIVAGWVSYARAAGSQPLNASGTVNTLP